MQFTSARGVAVAALALAAGFTALPAQAAPDQAREAVGLFAQSCLKHVEDPADLRAWIKATPQLRKFVAQEASAFLAGKRGDVWSAENDAGLFALVVYAYDTCSVIAQQASAAQVSPVFAVYYRRQGTALNTIGVTKDFTPRLINTWDTQT